MTRGLEVPRNNDNQKVGVPAELDEVALARELDERGMPAELDEAALARELDERGMPAELDEATPHETKCRVGYVRPTIHMRVVDTPQPDKQYSSVSPTR